MRLLIVEDEPRMRQVLVQAARSWGLDAAAVCSGEQAMRAMRAEASQIVLLDLNLPGMTGMECFEAIRREWPETQVVILTGFGDLEAARRAIHLDVVEFLTKPCHLGELEQALERARRRLEELAPAPAPEAKVDLGGLDPGPPTLDQMEREAILEALARNGGSRAATAAELGISLRTLYYRLSEYQRQGYRVD